MVLVTTGDDAEVADERSLATLALTARGTFGQLSPFAALVLPLDEEVRDAASAMLTLRVEYRLPAAR